MSEMSSTNEDKELEESIISRLVDHPGLLELAYIRRRYRIKMAGTVLAAFLVYLISWAFMPDIINTRFPERGSVSLGIWLTLAVIILGISLSGYYAMVIGEKLDRISKKLLDEVRDEEMS